MTPDEQKAAVAEAERLHGLATKGPWKSRKSIHGNQYRYVEIDRAEDYDTCEMLPNDARSIAALHNIAPVLFAAYRENERLRGALEKIAESRDAGRHDGLREECPLYDQYTMWLEARAALSTEER